MPLKNTSASYGFVTKVLHAIIAIAFIIQFGLIYAKHYLLADDTSKLSFTLLHKSVGFSLVFVGLAFLLWRVVNTKPRYPAKMPRWEIILATATHHLLYLVILLMPVTGTVMSMSSGKGIKWFGHPIPNMLPKNEYIASLFYNSHVYISYLVLVLFSLHMAGALKHYYIDKNNILQRMWR